MEVFTGLRLDWEKPDNNLIVRWRDVSGFMLHLTFPQQVYVEVSTPSFSIELYDLLTI